MPSAAFVSTPRHPARRFFFASRVVGFLGVKGAAEKKPEPAMKFLVMSCSKTREFQDTFPKITLPKTNIAPEDHPKRELVIQPSIFGCYVSFREGICFFLLLQCLEQFLKCLKFYLSNSLAQTVVSKPFMLKMPVIRTERQMKKMTHRISKPLCVLIHKSWSSTST